MLFSAPEISNSGIVKLAPVPLPTSKAVCLDHNRYPVSCRPVSLFQVVGFGLSNSRILLILPLYQHFSTDIRSSIPSGLSAGVPRVNLRRGSSTNLYGSELVKIQQKSKIAEANHFVGRTVGSNLSVY